MVLAKCIVASGRRKAIGVAGTDFIVARSIAAYKIKSGFTLVRRDATAEK
jgi:hypothetical protein